MRFFGKKITIQDFLPPIVVRLRSFVSRRLLNTGTPPQGAEAALYIHPMLESYSQFGEDLVLDALLMGKPTGSYIDVGANDPVRLSNTCRFYRRGWRGVNIEPSRTLWQRLNDERPEDINLNVGIGATSGTATFYEMTIDTYSTFNKGNSEEFCPGKEIAARIEMPIFTLSSIWAEHVGDRCIDFISVDVEGDNLAVLQGNDWKRFRPRFVLVEMDGAERLAIIAFLTDCNYELLYANNVNGIFGDRGRIRP
jgi:FkbM family methyltransferase